MNRRRDRRLLRRPRQGDWKAQAVQGVRGERRPFVVRAGETPPCGSEVVPINGAGQINAASNCFFSETSWQRRERRKRRFTRPVEHPADPDAVFRVSAGVIIAFAFALRRGEDHFISPKRRSRFQFRVVARNSDRLHNRTRTRHPHHERPFRFLHQSHRHGVVVRSLWEIDVGIAGKPARGSQHQARGFRVQNFNLRGTRRGFRAGGKRDANHQNRGRPVCVFPNNLGWRRDRGKRWESLLILIRCSDSNSRPRAVLVRPRPHHRRRCRVFPAVLQRHAFDFFLDFLLLRQSLLVRHARRSSSRRFHFLGVEVPQRHRVPLLHRREHLVRHARVGLEQHEPSSERRDVGQTHGFLFVFVFSFVVVFVVAAAKRHDVANALGDVFRAGNDFCFLIKVVSPLVSHAFVRAEPVRHRE
mmetsp:Transcript_13804/g.51720  ORF Transcript_13804/g.51720 Transcript_13804/m.51720 type:complete len:415 (-) Transcript_13804:800-2044(-)